jgi:predicted amidohydrolase
MERRNFIAAGLGAVAALGTTSFAKNVHFQDEKKKNKDKVCVSLLQSQFVGGPVESNPFHPKFDKKVLEKEVFEKNIDNICNLLEIAGERGSDVACTTEDIKGMYDTLMNFDKPELLIDNCETIPGKLTDRLGVIAKKYEMYVIACFLEKDNGKMYNTTVIIDRKGQILGKYHKIQLPTPETWVLTAGTEFPVFKTDFADIGIATCYDINFPEIVSCYALSGVDMLFHPTGGYGWTEDLGTSFLKVRAADHNIWIAAVKSSQLHGPGRSGIFNPLGQVVADAGYELNTVLTSYINPKETWVQPDFSYGAVFTGVPNMRSRFSLERRPEIYKMITNPHPPILDKYKGDKLISDRGKQAQKEVFERMKKQMEKDALNNDQRIGLTRGVL